MVNVPGRSKGCHNCRRRKIACDQQRPACAKCEQRGLVCEGYERERMFVVDQAAYRGRGQKVSESCSKTPTFDAGNEKTTSLESGLESSLIQARRQKYATAPTESAQHSFMSLVTHSPSSTAVNQSSAYRSGLLGYFREASRPFPWVSFIQHSLAQSPALEVAVISLVSARLGRLHHDPRLTANSLGLYSRSLFLFRKSLQDPKQLTTDETLATCLTLGLYELMECPGGRPEGYMSHREGCVWLVRLRGPERCRDGWGRALWNIVRLHHVYIMVKNRGTSFVVQEPWSEISAWSAEADPFYNLIGVLAKLPALLSRIEALGVGQLDLIKTWIEAGILIQNLWELDGELDACYEEQQQLVDGPLFWYDTPRSRVLSDLHAESDVTPSAIIRFPDMTTADTLTMYWTLQVRIWTLLIDLYRKFTTLRVMVGASYRQQQTLQPLNYREAWMEPLRKIGQSTEYYLVEDEFGLATGRIGFALSQVKSELEKHPEYHLELEWIRRCHDSVVHRMSFLKHLI